MLQSLSIRDFVLIEKLDLTFARGPDSGLGALTGGVAVMNTNHHLSKPVLIGEIRADGQFNVVWKTKKAIKADAWSKFIPESAKLTADWTYPWVCGNCEKPKFGG